MHKKLILASAGLIALTAFVALTAFKTLEQQKQEIAAAITARLDELRAQKEEECTIRITDEAQRRYDEFVATQAPATSSVKSAARPTKKSKSTTPAKVDPLPQTAPANQGVDRPGATRKDAPAAPVERPGAIEKNETPTPVARPGAKKKEGGN